MRARLIGSLAVPLVPVTTIVYAPTRDAAICQPCNSSPFRDLRSQLFGTSNEPVGLRAVALGL